MDTIQKLEKKYNDGLKKENNPPEFFAGDSLRVNVKVVEGTRERVQSFEGVCIARRNAGINSAFTVRKISYGEGVERVFPLYSPNIESIKVIRHGDVRRAKLYYLRDRRGKAARIAEKKAGYAAKLATGTKKSSTSPPVSEPAAPEKAKPKTAENAESE